MSDDLSKHFRAGAKPIEIDMLKKKVKIPDSPKAYVSYVDIVRLFRLQRKLSKDIEFYEIDLVINHNREDDVPREWDDFDPISVAATLGDISIVLEQVKEKLLYWESYEALSYENNLQRYPELDKAGIQIDVRALIQLQEPSVGIEAEEQEPKLFVHLFGHAACDVFIKQPSTKSGVSIGLEKMIPVSDAVMLLEELKAIKEKIEAAKEKNHHEEVEASLVDKIRRLIQVSVEMDDLERIVEIEEELELFKKKGMDIDAISALVDQGYITKDNIGFPGTNILHYTRPDVSP